jgi:L-iditol 2-dehydrogenase
VTSGLPARGRVLYLTGPEQIELRELDLAPPGPGELLLAIDAATTCGTDLKVFLRGGHPRMLVVPGPFGHEMTGRVAAAGPGIESFATGDAIVVANSASCGKCAACAAGRENLCADLAYLNGAFADFLLVPARFVERSCHRRPDALPARVASLAEPLACVEHGIERLSLAGPRDVLVLGAGGLGLLFVAALAEEGQRVTAVDPHADRRSLAAELGAATTLAAGSGPPPREFDVVIDATGTTAGWAHAVAATRPGGSVLFFGGCPPDSVLELPTYPVHYDELALLGCYHHTPRTFGRALARLARAPERYARLVSAECSLEGVEHALRAMQARAAVKVRVRP